MNRKSFLKGIGLAGVGLTLAPTKVKAEEFSTTAGCTLIPSETAGPFPWDLTANNSFFRQDIREDRQGVPLNLKLRILGQDNCMPMPNVRVNIWHCDKDGAYSAYDNSMNPGQAGKTYCRGWQISDANGEVNYTTIFPGWYQGRICHIHFQVYVSSVYAAISQLTFPLAEKNALYAANSSLYTKGADPLSFTQDNIFSDGYNYQLATLTANNDGSYSSFMEVTVRGSGITGLIEAEPETGGQFTLGQNYPNPSAGQTTIPFTLAAPSHVHLALFDLNGRMVAEIVNTNLPDGAHTARIDMAQLGLPIGTYAYQLEVKNSRGTFRQSKVITGN